MEREDFIIGNNNPFISISISISIVYMFILLLLSIFRNRMQMHYALQGSSIQSKDYGFTLSRTYLPAVNDSDVVVEIDVQNSNNNNNNNNNNENSDGR